MQALGPFGPGLLVTMLDVVSQILERAARRAEQAAFQDSCESNDDEAGDQSIDIKRRPEIAWGWFEATQHPQIKMKLKDSPFFQNIESKT